VRRVSGRKTPLLRRLWQGRFPFLIWDAKVGDFGVTKTSKTRLWAFPKQGHVDTYAQHPRALARVAFSGSLQTGSIGAEQALAEFVSGPVPIAGEAIV